MRIVRPAVHSGSITPVSFPAYHFDAAVGRFLEKNVSRAKDAAGSVEAKRPARYTHRSLFAREKPLKEQ
jgi:hypothetical protein